MAFENKTIEDINNLIIQQLQNELNTKFRLLPKSFIRVLAKVLSAVFITLYKQQAWIFLQLFVDTATIDEVVILGRRIRPLVLWGALVGIGEPKEAIAWKGKLKIKTLRQSEYLPAGTQFVSAGGKIYLTEKTIKLDESEPEISIFCTESGVDGNLEVGDELKTTAPLAAIGEIGVVTDSKEGADAENSEDYRERIRQRWRIQPQGGSLADYRNWASDVEGVRQTYVYEDEESASGVILYVAAQTESRIASETLLVEVGEACTYNPKTGEARKPIGAVIDPDYDGKYRNVRSCSVTGFDVYVEGVQVEIMDSFKKLCKENLKNYFLDREPYVRGLSADNVRSDRIQKTNVVGIVNDVAESLSGYFENAYFKLEDEDEERGFYTLGRGELAKLNKLYVDGVEVE